MNEQQVTSLNRQRIIKFLRKEGVILLKLQERFDNETLSKPRVCTLCNFFKIQLRMVDHKAT